MKHLVTKTCLILFALLSITSCKKGTSTEPSIASENPIDTIVCRKPNIYIYPTQDIQLNIKLNFPAGGRVTESKPQYDNGWNVNVSRDGTINNYYHYLYYECNVPDLTQKEFGWVISKNEIENFFTTNLSESGFSNQEIKDFIDYWIPKLNNYDYYEIYPQYITDMNKMSVLEFSVMPDHIFRLTYLVKGRNDNNVSLKLPIIQKSIRTRFAVLEWGVILK